ncbi:hypothetical protein TR13x_04965 [Caloranaerobacter sp. TR13]|uniref:S-layer homology domain-containing protein n=1 Tax=Caloranaerobacter sp. TR13 TaxID=1302151 RepID=UPI0006D3F8D0|nr:S-layer homology domain-containing protein [Caloranaerobacter sp. TR13]KPU27424.1 hypothetical protein TR13x_04965 [Caloranaerobacter sp. TR13]
MNLKKARFMKLFTLVFVVVILLGSTSSYAQIFTDVPDDFWALEYIKKVKDLGIITGYPDATFKPYTEVTRTQALVMIARLFKTDEDSINEIKAKYKDLLNELNVENWAQDGIAVALDKGIISESVLREFYISGKAKEPATKDEICIYLTRAMGLEEELKSSQKIIVLPFKDAEVIPPQIAPYVDMMIQKGIINEKGDSEGKFNPKAPMNRAIMAKVLSIAYDYIKDNQDASANNNDNQINADNNTEKTVEVSGVIADILNATNETYIVIEDETKKKSVYKLDPETSILLDDEKVSIEDLSTGLEVKLNITKDNKVKSITGKSIEEHIKGTVKFISFISPAKLTVEYNLNDEIKNATYFVSDEASITLDGKEAFLYHIREGDRVDLEIRNKKIVKIVAESKNKHINGVLKEIKYDKEPILVIENSEKGILEYPIANKAVVTRNSNKIDFVDLKIGDKIEVDLTYDIITEIKAVSVRSEDKGTIRSIFISSTPEITLVNEDGEEKTYLVSKDASIEISGDKKSIYDLRLGHYVTVEVESNEIVSLRAEVKELNDKYVGNIAYINGDIGLIVIEQNSGDYKELYITEQTKFIKSDTTKINISSLAVGDEVIAFGKENSGVFGKFICDTILLVK